MSSTRTTDVSKDHQPSSEHPTAPSEELATPLPLSEGASVKQSDPALDNLTQQMDNKVLDYDAHVQLFFDRAARACMQHGNNSPQEQQILREYLDFISGWHNPIDPSGSHR